VHMLGVSFWLDRSKSSISQTFVQRKENINNNINDPQFLRIIMHACMFMFYFICCNV
jgi:hypothetical protein